MSCLLSDPGCCLPLVLGKDTSKRKKGLLHFLILFSRIHHVFFLLGYKGAFLSVSGRVENYRIRYHPGLCLSVGILILFEETNLTLCLHILSLLTKFRITNRRSGLERLNWSQTPAYLCLVLVLFSLVGSQ
jgi:hypothetical protein